MRIGFHYNALYLLMLRMGVSASRARDIASCSQYVDDATESSPFRLELPDGTVKMFDPCCTAHKGLQLLLGINPDMQRKVYVPFHFLPLEFIMKGKRKFDWRAGPNGIFSRALGQLTTQRVFTNFHANSALLGIALHVIADGYSHEGFSGRSGSENVVEGVEVQGGNDPRWSSTFAALTPPIGHAKLLDIPDIPNLRWRAKKRKWRSNADVCRAALITCGNVIYRMGMDGVSFREEWVDPIVEHLVADEWPTEVKENPYVDLATRGLRKKAPLVRDRDGAPSVTFAYSWTDNDAKLFFGFHAAAWSIRKWVLERIPHNL